MASATPLLSDLISEELKCAICLHRLKKPRALGCLHSFCGRCLGKYVDERATSGPVICPLCQKETALLESGVKALPSDFRALKLIEVLEQEERQRKRKEIVHMCDVCESTNAKANTLYIHCSECAQIMCEQCGNAHGRMRISQSHTVAPVSNFKEETDATSPDASEGGSTNICPNHEGYKLDTFCTTCLVPVCEECITTDHPVGDNHDHVLLSEFLPTMREQLGTGLAQIADRSSDHTMFLSMINSLESTMAIQEDLFERKLEVAIKSIRQHVSRWKEDIKMKRGKFMELQRRELKNLREQSERDKKSLELNESKVKDVLEPSGNHIDLARSFHSLRESLALSETPNNSGLEVINKAVSQLQFHVANDALRIGNLMFPYRDKRNIAIPNCYEGPSTATFTRDGRLAVVAQFLGAKIEPLKEVCYEKEGARGYKTYDGSKHYEPCIYYAIKQTEAQYESSGIFGMELRSNIVYSTLASLSDSRFVTSQGIFASKFNDRKVGTFNNLPLTVTCVVTDLGDNIYLADGPTNNIYVYDKNGTRRESISTGTLQPHGIALCPRDPKEILMTASDCSKITVIHRSGNVLRTIDHPDWKEVAIGVDNDRLVYVLWKDTEDNRTLQRYSIEGQVIDTLFEKEPHKCKKLILAVSPGGTAAVVTGEKENAEITVISMTRELSE